MLKLSGLLDRDSVVGYVLSKLGSDGGYLSYQYMDMFESSAEDTFYALAVMRTLGVEPPRAADTKAFLRCLQHEGGGYTSLPVAYYAVKALKLLGAEPRDPNGAARYLREALEYAVRRGREEPRSNIGYVGEEHFMSDGSLKSFDATSVLVEAEMPTALADASLASEALAVLGRKPVDLADRVAALVLEYRTPDGGFGTWGSSIEAVYHAVKTLLLLGRGEELSGVAEWVLRCENPKGGFSVRPGVKTQFLEHLFYGVETLYMLGAEPRYPEAHVRLICTCQNGDGGFRRSPVLGLSTLENTYYAVSVLSRLGYL